MYFGNVNHCKGDWLFIQNTYDYFYVRLVVANCNIFIYYLI